MVFIYSQTQCRCTWDSNSFGPPGSPPVIMSSCMYNLHKDHTYNHTGLLRERYDISYNIEEDTGNLNRGTQRAYHNHIILEYFSL